MGLSGLVSKNQNLSGTSRLGRHPETPLATLPITQYFQLPVKLVEKKKQVMKLLKQYFTRNQIFKIKLPVSSSVKTESKNFDY